MHNTLLSGLRHQPPDPAPHEESLESFPRIQTSRPQLRVTEMDAPDTALLNPYFKQGPDVSLTLRVLETVFGGIRLSQQFSTGMLLLKHVVPDCSVRGPDLFP